MRKVETNNNLNPAASALTMARPGTAVLLVAFFIIFSSCLDAYFTLLHLQNGAREANPFMNLALEIGPLFFFTVKTMITGAGVLALVAVPRSKLRAVGLGIVAFCYSVLLTYHASLFVLHGGM